ncbi:MAG: peptidoglycan DD-metalloendopeptidase family protein [Candidatus Zixiibacteriota bacterium]
MTVRMCGAIATVVFVLSGVVRADDESADILRQKVELEKIQKDVDAGQRRLDSLEAEQGKVLKAIGKYDERIASDRQVLRRLNKQLSQLQADIKRGDSLLNAYREQYDRRQRRYLGNIRQFYALARKPMKAFTADPNEELEYNRKIVYLTALADFESGTVRDASAMVDQSAVQLGDMSDRQKQISTLKKERETSRALGESQKQRQEKSLDQLRRKSMAEADRVISLRQAAEEMQNILERLEKARLSRPTPQADKGPSAFAALQGKLLAPCRGKIVVNFGEQVDPVTRLRSFSPGVSIRARPGADIDCVASGTVAYSGNLRGYGNFVIINHDHQFYSTYAGLGEILVSEGQFVASRTRLGRAAKDGVVRFELRNGREPLDPVKWIQIESL